MTQPSIAELDQELTRLEAEYRRRDAGSVPATRYSFFNEAALLHAQGLERVLLKLLKQHNFTNLAEKKILDVGCGSGSHLRRFLDYGALPANLSGIDLMERRVEQARRLHPALDYRVGSAHQLPYPTSTFDLVMSFVVFSSVLSDSLRHKMADEMWRVRRPGGLLLFYDFAFSNPRNPAVRGITRQQINQLFDQPKAKFDFRRITLAPPISRRVAPLSHWLACTLEQLTLLNTHTMCIISLD